MARAFPTPLEALAASADAAALRAAGLTADIADCARESELDVVPAVVRTSGGVAIVAGADRPSRAPHFVQNEPLTSCKLGRAQRYAKDTAGGRHDELVQRRDRPAAVTLSLAPGSSSLRQEVSARRGSTLEIVRG